MYNNPYNGMRGYGNAYSRSSANYSPRGSYSRQPRKKWSGCRAGIIKTGKNKGQPYIVGWKFDRVYGMRTFLCTPYAKTREVKPSPKGHKRELWMVTIKGGNGTGKSSCFYDLTTKNVRIPDLGLVLVPGGDFVWKPKK